MPISQKDLDTQTEKLAKLIKSEIGGVRTDMEKRFKFQEKRLLAHIDDKFETHRRLAVDDMQNFQDAIITEVKEIRQETDVNSSHRITLNDHEKRITKVEKAVFSN